MSEPEVSTKSPENDALEAVPIATATSSTQDEAPATSENPQTLEEPSETEPQTSVGTIPSGELTQLGGIDVYISKPADYPHSPSKFLLFLTGGTGLSSTNQLQADVYAKNGFVVVMPDLFAGDPAPNTFDPNAPDPNGASASLLERIKLHAAETAKSFLIDMWLARHTPEKVLPIIYTVLQAAKDEFADAVANGDGVYAVGYSFGGKYVILLAAEGKQGDEEEGKKAPEIKAGAVAHATAASREDMEGIKAPLTFVCVGPEDPLFPPEVVDVGRTYMKMTGIPYEIEMFERVPHGFAILGGYTDPAIKEAQSKAFEQMLKWLQSH
ncbi:MAG: hypothetical protein M1834_007259 [Cirrosporium novae-zelandiae]|nr:MAG: hypothetical protein M1834_007259 [Cirrosporium novae-zelandiae]